MVSRDPCIDDQKLQLSNKELATDMGIGQMVSYVVHRCNSLEDMRMEKYFQILAVLDCLFGQLRE